MRSGRYASGPGRWCPKNPCEDECRLLGPAGRPTHFLILAFALSGCAADGLPVVGFVPAVPDAADRPDLWKKGGCNTTGLQAGAPWPMAGYCPAHAGRSPYAGPRKPTVRWSFSAVQGFLHGSLVIAADGTVFAGTVGTGTLLALDGATGKRKWEEARIGALYSPPALGADGTLYVGTSTAIRALEASTGATKWEFPREELVSFSAPAVGPDGTVYIGSRERLHALEGVTGTMKWAFFAPGGYPFFSSPAVGPDGTVYLGYSSEVFALEGVTGMEKWRFRSSGAHSFSSPAIGADGTIYSGSSDGEVFALEGSDGREKWTFRGGEPSPFSSPAIGVDGTIYIGCGEFTCAIDGGTGLLRWRTATGWVMSAPSIGADGTVYVGSYDRSVYALDPATGEAKWSFPTGGIVENTPVIGADGTLYFGSEYGSVYALGP